jgi:pimeloyl-ACP methyl ester carboxylesterase
MPEQLNPEGTPVAVGTVVIRTFGLVGEVEVHHAGSPGMRGEEQTTLDLLEALERAGMDEQLSVVVSHHRELVPSTGTRASGGSDDIVVDVPAPGDGNGQVLLYAAEDGSLSWHLPDDIAPAEVPSRGGERRTYRVPRAVVEPGAPTSVGHRGLLGAVGTKVLKLLVFPLVDPALGRVGDFFASRWEDRHRLNRVRWMGLDDYARPTGSSFGADDWARLGEGRALVFVHGTFSTAHGAFGSIPRPAMETLHAAYGGRVAAFDHHSVSASPEENAHLLESLVPAGLVLDLDLVTHSRGGLVGRELSALDTVRVRGIVQVAAPNGGTVLADREHLADLLGRLTNLAQFIPDNGVTDTLALVLAVVKQLAVAAVGGLDGLTCMEPTGRYLESLNARSSDSTALSVIAADYEPAPGSPLGRIVRDGATDLLFRTDDNDLVVPTKGCYDVPGAAGFPVERRLVLDSSHGVDHNSFFRNPAVTEHLLEWLPTP